MVIATSSYLLCVYKESAYFHAKFMAQQISSIDSTLFIEYSASSNKRKTLNCKPNINTVLILLAFQTEVIPLQGLFAILQHS